MYWRASPAAWGKADGVIEIQLLPLLLLNVLRIIPHGAQCISFNVVTITVDGIVLLDHSVEDENAGLAPEGYLLHNMHLWWHFLHVLPANRSHEYIISNLTCILSHRNYRLLLIHGRQTDVSKWKHVLEHLRIQRLILYDQWVWVRNLPIFVDKYLPGHPVKALLHFRLHILLRTTILKPTTIQNVIILQRNRTATFIIRL